MDYEVWNEDTKYCDFNGDHNDTLDVRKNLLDTKNNESGAGNNARSLDIDDSSIATSVPVLGTGLTDTVNCNSNIFI